MSERRAILILRLALGFVWLLTGALCIGWTDEGRVLIGRVGLEGAVAEWTIQLTSGFEILLGMAVIAGLWRRLIAALQIVLILGFTVIVTIYLPEFWWHPFGPISKNVVLIAAALVTGARQS